MECFAGIICREDRVKGLSSALTSKQASCSAPIACTDNAMGAGKVMKPREQHPKLLFTGAA